MIIGVGSSFPFLLVVAVVLPVARARMMRRDLYRDTFCVVFVPRHVSITLSMNVENE